MLLLQLPRPALPLLWSHAANPHGDDAVSNHIFILVLTLACIGGALHGLAMALRKQYGEGHEKYWLEWRWWIGFVADGIAGSLIWPAMPLVSVQILVPLIIVVQLGSSYILGIAFFNEQSTLRHNIGLGCAALGVIGISLSTSHQAAHFTIDEFWARWVTTRFLLANVFVVLAMIAMFPFVHRSTFWALAAAALEGVQYICSRTIVDTIFDLMHGFLTQPEVAAAFLIKGLCILLILHFQQLGFEADLFRFAGIYLVGCVLFMCIYGWAFFGDEMPLTLVFAISTMSTLAGIWLLNQTKEETEEKAKSTARSPGDSIRGSP